MIWLVLAVCLLFIAAIVMWPFLRPAPIEERRPYEDWNRASLKAALAAVDKDEARGVLSPQAAQAQRIIIAQKGEALEQAGRADLSQSSLSQSSGHSGFIIAAAALVFAPGLLFGAYILLGTAAPEAAQQAALTAQQAQQPQNLTEAIAAIEARIEADPDNGRLWAVLSDLKIRNQDLSGAEAALEKAVNLPTESDKEKAQLWLILAMTRRSQGLPLSDESIIEPLEMSLSLDAASPAAILLERAQSETPQAPD